MQIFLMQREQLGNAVFFYPVSQAKTQTVSIIMSATSWAASTAPWAAGEGWDSAPVLCSSLVGSHLQG